jgi:AcrR family transcriptional regulator
VQANLHTRTSRGRPKDPARRERIVREALAAFADRGYGGTTMREIAARCGVAETQLYRDFPSKERLFAAAIDYVEERQDAVRAAIAVAASATERVRPFLERAGVVFQRYVEDMAPWYTIWFSRPPLSEARRTRLVGREEAVVREIAVILERRGTLRSPHRTARLFVDAIVGDALLSVRAGSGSSARADRMLLVSELAATLIDGATHGDAPRRVR